MLILILQDLSTACHESVLASINTIYIDNLHNIIVIINNKGYNILNN